MGAILQVLSLCEFYFFMISVKAYQMKFLVCGQEIYGFVSMCRLLVTSIPSTSQANQVPTGRMVRFLLQPVTMPKIRSLSFILHFCLLSRNPLVISPLLFLMLI